jgi:hypothetical protein
MKPQSWSTGVKASPFLRPYNSSGRRNWQSHISTERYGSGEYLRLGTPEGFV